MGERVLQIKTKWLRRQTKLLVRKNHNLLLVVVVDADELFVTFDVERTVPMMELGARWVLALRGFFVELILDKIEIHHRELRLLHKMVV